MIQVYPAQSRYYVDRDWLKSYYSFSFADYHDPENVRFGPLRVFNDDIIAPGKGFGPHPHHDMEIVTVVLKGYLKHEDSTGQAAVTTFGEIQRMSAGSGIIHSEMNPSQTEEVQLLQIWFEPEQRGLPPSYEHTRYDLAQMKNRLLPVVSRQGDHPHIARINQDLTLYLSDLEPGQQLEFVQEPGRRIFLFVIEGSLRVVPGTSDGSGSMSNDKTGIVELARRDSVRITEESRLQLHTREGARLMLIDLP